MQELVNDFIKTLRTQKDLYVNILRLSEEKKTALADNSIDDLDRLVRAEQALLIKANDIERRRKVAADAVVKAAGVNKPGLKLREIAEILPEKYKTEIMELHAEFADVLARQLKINQINQQLLESRIAYFNYMIGTMSQGGDSTNRYGAGGEDARPKDQKVNLIDHKV